MKITRVDAPKCLVGEGPVWDAAEQALFYLDIIGKKVHRYHPETGATRTWELPTIIGTLALRAAGGAVITQDDGFYALDFGTGGVTQLAPIEGKPKRVNFNDGKADRRGRFVVGLSDSQFVDTQPVGGLLSLGANHKVTNLDKGIHFSNSPCFSPDDKTLYFADSFLGDLYAYDYDIVTGEVANRRVHINTGALGGLPDGATVDRDGLVWIAIFEAGKIAAIRPDGKVEREVPVPVKMVSSVMFGGPNLDQLYFTSVDGSFFNQASEEGSGHLFVIEGLGARGVAEPRYAG